MAITRHNLINSLPSARASTTVVGSVASDATSITVSSALSIAAPFKATFVDNGEIIEVGTISGTAWSNITRGAEGTTAASHSAGSTIELRITAGHLTERSPFNVYPQATAAENTLAIRAAIAQGYVSFAPGDYPVARTGTESALFEVNDAIEIAGNGSNIILDGSTPNTVDVFYFNPNGNINLRGLHLHDFWLYPASHNAGRYGLHFNCPATPEVNGFFSNVRVSHIIVGADTKEFGTASIRITNPTSDNGFFCSQFRDMFCWGNISAERIGDSVVFDGVEVYTPNSRIGFDISLVENAGETIFANCNCIAAAGVFKAVLTGNSTIKLHNCNFEHITNDSLTTGAITYIQGGQDVVVSGCRSLQINAGPSSAHGLSLVGVNAPTVIGNQLQGYGTGYDLILNNTCVNSYAPQASNRCYQSRYSNAGTNRAAI